MENDYLWVSMLKSTTGLISVFMLFLFLFPQVQKGVHDFEHRNDFHCNEKSEKHFHTLEHVCTICDFSVPVGKVVNTELNSLFVFYFYQPYNVFSGEFVPSDSRLRVPPRAPPV